jgi:transmembrane sensor
MEPDEPIDWNRLRSDAADVERRVDWDRGLRGARARFLLTAQRPWPRSHGWRSPMLPTMFAVAACLVAVFGWVGYRQHGPITFNTGIERTAGQLGDLIYSPGSEPVPVHFSDGTSLSMAASTLARVTETNAHGATVVLENGAMSFAVVHRPASHWSIAAGPFTVFVTGTKFDVRWSNVEETLVLDLHEGSVTVMGPSLGPSGRRVFPGESLRVSVPGAHATAAEQPSTGTIEMGPPAVGRDEPTKNVDIQPGVASHGAWKELALEGRYADALVAAEAEGFENACRRAPTRDLLLLGYTARFAGSTKRAEQALALVQTRPTARHEVAMSAFTLGRIEYDDRQNYPEAARWFQSYLREEPSGGLAREAAGRLIEAQRAGGDIAAARESASLYLARYPSGPHASLARSVLGQ